MADTTSDIVSDVNGRIERGKSSVTEALADNSREMVKKLNEDKKKEEEKKLAEEHKDGEPEPIDSTDTAGPKGADLGASEDQIPEDELKLLERKEKEEEVNKEEVNKEEPSDPDSGKKDGPAKDEPKEEHKDGPSDEKKRSMNREEMTKIQKAARDCECEEAKDPDLIDHYDALQEKTDVSVNATLQTLSDRYDEIQGEVKELGLDKDKPLSEELEKYLESHNLTDKDRTYLEGLRNEAREIEDTYEGAKESIYGITDEDRENGMNKYLHATDPEKAEEVPGKNAVVKASETRPATRKVPGLPSDPKNAKNIGAGMKTATENMNHVKKVQKTMKKAGKAVRKVVKKSAEFAKSAGIVGTTGALCSTNPWTAAAWSAVMTTALGIKTVRSNREQKEKTAEGAIGKGNTEAKHMTKNAEKKLQHVRSAAGQAR